MIEKDSFREREREGGRERERVSERGRERGREKEKEVDVDNRIEKRLIMFHILHWLKRQKQSRRQQQQFHSVFTLFPVMRASSLIIFSSCAAQEIRR